ncbi:MAG: tetratricopeptide repeat protein [Woeseiaceae bacterium]
MQSARFAIFVSDVAVTSLRRLILCAAFLVTACSPAEESPRALSNTPATYHGSESCRDCHADEYALWQGSDHAVAMQHATPDTVLGDFSDIEFTHFDTTSRFFRRDDRFFVLTDNADGGMEEFLVSYTFGVEPLQQYLIEFPDGRLQTLPLAWDTRAADAGGQRWYHIYPDEPIESGDELHWTGREQNWNYMCAECHSTNLVKNYDVASDSFDTSWFEINVGCEACHGPSSAHAEQAAVNQFDSQHGLVVNLDDAGRAVWQMNPATGIAVRSELRMRPPQQPEACGRCHARRGIIDAEYAFGHSLLDTHAPALLDDNLYFADGQIREEVYVYGSFLQSRMYQAGVSCSDCHEPHSGALRTGSDPNTICSTCHLPEKFSSTEHHRHVADTVGCVDCHMTSRDYMVVDGRRDHSFRLPRPDLSMVTGAPNACNQCHIEQDADWASAALTAWYGNADRDHYGFALHAARTGEPDANAQLLAVIDDSANPGIARGTAFAELRPPISQELAATIRTGLGNGDPFVRIGALRAMSGLPPEVRAEWAAPLLADSLRAVRIEAVRLVSPLRSLLPPLYQRDFAAAEVEHVDALMAVAERPEAHANLGSLYGDAGKETEAEAAFQTALRIGPDSVFARINFADHYRRLNRDGEAEALLREGLDLGRGAADIHHSLGLLLVRSDRQEEGLEELRLAVNAGPDNARYAYVYAVALNSLGQPDAATKLLSDVKDRFPADFDIHWALATILRDQGETAAAREVAAGLAQRYPDVQQVQSLLDSL